MPVAVLRVVPTAPQQTDLLSATNEWRQALDNPAIEASSDPTLTHYAPQPQLAGNSLKFAWPEVLIIESGAGQVTGQFPDHDTVGRRHSLHPCCQVQCLADCDALLGGSLTDQLAYHH